MNVSMENTFNALTQTKITATISEQTKKSNWPWQALDLNLHLFTLCIFFTQLFLRLQNNQEETKVWSLLVQWCQWLGNFRKSEKNVRKNGISKMWKKGGEIHSEWLSSWQIQHFKAILYWFYKQSLKIWDEIKENCKTQHYSFKSLADFQDIVRGKLWNLGYCQ